MLANEVGYNHLISNVSTSGRIVVLKTLPKYRKLNKIKALSKLIVSNVIKICNCAKLCLHFCRAGYNGSYTVMAKPMKTLELLLLSNDPVFNNEWCFLLAQRKT